MSYSEFREEIFCALQKIVPDDLILQSVEVEKTNGCIRFGISFGRAEVSYAPTIYLEPFYRRFLEGKSVEQLAAELLTCYEEEADVVPDGVECLREYDSAHAGIFCKLLHLEENHRLLLDTPHLIFLDFAVVAYYEIDSTNQYKGSVLIKDYFLDFWNITKEQLFADSLNNTRQQKKLYFRTMSDFIPQTIFEENEEVREQIRRGMFILTNEERYLGSILVYFPEVLEQVAEELGEDFYMLPSSIHEWIILPVSMAEEPEFLLSMVRDINLNEVQEEEVLSNNIYHYSMNAKDEKITCITSPVS